MKINIESKVEKLLKIIKDDNITDITGYKVSKSTCVPASSITYLKLGKSKINNLSVTKAEALYNYMVELEETDERFK